MTTDEIKQKIEQGKKNMQWYLDMATMLEKQVAGFEKQLAEAEKPKLRHGDYGWDGFKLWLCMDHSIYLLDKKRMCTIPANEFIPGTIYGNLVADLAALAEDRTEWLIEDGAGDECRVCLQGHDYVVVHTDNLGVDLTFDAAESLARALLQIVATAKRRQGNV